MSKGKPRRQRNPKRKKEARSDPRLTPENQNLIWEVSKIDKDGQWGWDKVNCSYFFTVIWEKMRNFEKKKWSEILGGDHYQNHKIRVSRIRKEAQKRLKELGHDDQEELVSLRLTNKQRLWAIQLEGKAFLLWWDPNHEICPSLLKHT